MKKLMAIVLAFLLSASLLVGCGGNGGSAESDVIKVGFLGPLTGDVAQYGIAVRDGVKMYINKLNEEGGVLGKQIQLIEEDEKGDPTEALNGFNKLVDQDKVVAIFGSVTSGPTIAVSEASSTMDNPIPMITASATAEDVTSFGDNMFRTCFLDPFQGETMAKFASEVLDAKTAGVIYNNGTDYSTGLYESFKETCKALGIDVVAEESYQDGDVDFKSQLTNIAAANPDVLLVPDYYNQVALIAHQSAELGITCALLGCDGWDGVLNATETPEDLANAYFSNHYSSDDPDPVVQDFLKAYKEVYGEDPMSFAATGYDAAMVMFDAISRAGTTESSAVVQALKDTDLACVTGRIIFDEKCNPIKTCAIVKFVLDEATGKYNYAFDRKI